MPPGSPLPRRARALALLALALPACTSGPPGEASASAPASAAAPAAASASASASASAAAPAAAAAPASASAPADVPAVATLADAGADASGAGAILASTSADPAAPPPPCPADMALVGRFCVDRYEGHLVTVSESGERSVHPHHERPQAGARYIAQSAAGVFPQAYISRVESKAACEAAGKRLCRRKEWLRACRGDGRYMYPYGARGVRGRCVTGKPHLLTVMFGNKRGGWSYEDFNSPKLDLEPGYLARAGEYEGCASELGVHDMVGNLHEWVADMVDQEVMDRLAEEGVERREQPWVEGNGVFMGGFFSTTSELGPGCYYTTVAHEPSYHDYSTGFRCCADAALPPAEGAPRAAGATPQRPASAAPPRK